MCILPAHHIQRLHAASHIILWVYLPSVGAIDDDPHFSSPACDSVFVATLPVPLKEAPASRSIVEVEDQETDSVVDMGSPSPAVCRLAFQECETLVSLQKALVLLGQSGDVAGGVERARTVLIGCVQGDPLRIRRVSKPLWDSATAVMTIARYPNGDRFDSFSVCFLFHLHLRLS